MKFNNSNFPPFVFCKQNNKQKSKKSKPAPSNVNFFDRTSSEPNFMWEYVLGTLFKPCYKEPREQCKSPRKNQTKLYHWSLFKSVIVVTICNAELRKKTHSGTITWNTETLASSKTEFCTVISAILPLDQNVE